MKKKVILRILYGFILLQALFFISGLSWQKSAESKIPLKIESWKTASRKSAKLAPLPKEDKSAIIQFYAAPLWGLRGLVADHTWISTKEKGADSYTVYELIGWRMMQGYPDFLRAEKDTPDRFWFGKKPKILFDLRGKQAEKLIDKIHKAVLQYPYKGEYSMLGPNSNTFIAWVLCKVPELNLNLSRRAIGKSYLKNCKIKKEDSVEKIKPL